MNAGRHEPNAMGGLGGTLTSLRNRAADFLLERRLNIRTTGRHTVDVADAVAYSTFAYAGIFRVLERLELDDQDVLADVGCGKGRVVCAAALQSMRRVVGIDVDEHLCRLARANADRMRYRRAPVEIVHCSSGDFNFRDCTVIFLFNPFNRGPLQSVLHALQASLGENPRNLRVAYVNPRHDNAVADSGSFERYDHWPFSPRSRLKFAVSFRRSTRVSSSLE